MKTKTIALSEVLTMPDQVLYPVTQKPSLLPNHFEGNTAREYAEPVTYPSGGKHFHEVVKRNEFWTYINDEWLSVTADISFKEFKSRIAQEILNSK